MLETRFLSNKFSLFRGQNGQINYILLALETGLCLTALSSSRRAWAQTVEPRPETEGPPQADQPAPQGSAAAPQPAKDRGSAPEVAAAATFSASPRAAPPDQPGLNPPPARAPAPMAPSAAALSVSPSQVAAPATTSGVQFSQRKPAVASAETPSPSPSPNPAVEFDPPPIKDLLPAVANSPQAHQSRTNGSVPLDTPPSPPVSPALPPPHQAEDDPGIPPPYSTSAQDLLSPQPEISAPVRFSAKPMVDALEPQRETDRAEISKPDAAPASATPNRPGREDFSSSTSNPQDLTMEASLTEPIPIPPGALDPLVTTIPFNQDVLEYGPQTSIAGGVSFGNERSTNPNYGGLVSFNPSLESQTSPDHVITLAQRQTVGFVRNVLQERVLTVGFGEPVTLLGQDIQFSLTGSCLDPAVGEICTYTPGLATDNGSLDEQTQLPTRFVQSSNFGDGVAPATLEAMQAPGFQQGTAEQPIGLDLTFPVVATLPGNSQSDSTIVQRHEQLTTTPVLGFATVSQTVQSNAAEAALARTIRGPAVVWDPDQPVTNYVLAALALLLPEVKPFVPPTADPANPNINQSLFHAANNTRLPTNSLTLYQAGVGHAHTPAESLTSSHERPRANFNAIWLGLSPVTERSYAQRVTLEPTGARVLTLAAGGEGGGGEAPDVTSIINGEIFNVQTVDNVYSQNYVNLYEQDALNLYTFEQTDRTRYYPHLSFSGNITGAYDTFRYYAGSIAGPTIQAYGGLDYQGRTDDGWYYRAGAIGFINPNYDRYSNLSGGLAKRFDFNPTQSFTLGSSFNWALDQDTTLGDIEQTGEGSDVTLQARLNLGQFSLGVTQVLGDLLPNSQANRTVLDTSIQLGENVVLAGFWAPFDTATTSPLYGVMADIGLTMGEVTPRLVVSWESIRYDYGQDPGGNDLITTSNVFEVLLRMQW